jgi:predicted transcriptional regulator
MAKPSGNTVGKELLFAMADPKSIFDNEDESAEEQALLAAEADIAAGRTVGWEDVERWLKSWGTINELPPPECK